VSDRPRRENGEPTPDEFCREIERYLTRKNDGHLIRIVGPSFERVCDWARRGIPLKIAFAGIDRHFERYYRKGPRRRPVLVDFCEPDILDVFDQWRQAVGLAGGVRGGKRPAAQASLASQIERIVARLTLLRSSGAGDMPVADDVLADVIRDLDRLTPVARRARGAARSAVFTELARLDARLLASARERMDPVVLRDLEGEADRDLAPFRDRMPGDQWPKTREAAIARQVRARAGLPDLPVE
jgi:hypothetical protein